MKSKIDYRNSLLKFSEGKYTYRDYVNVKGWFADSKEDQQAEEALFDQWKDTSNPSDENKHKELFRKIHYNILLEDRTSPTPQSWLFYYRQIAAILVPILVLTGLLYFILDLNPAGSQSWVEINAPAGAKTEFQLPDGTTGWLNNGAKLWYPTVNSKNREVKLTGEAYFRVKHLMQGDFTVHVPDMDIKVLGTKFNVSAYENEAKTVVVLEEGKVEVAGTKTKFNHTLKPGEILSFDHGYNKLASGRIDPTIYTAWTQGFLVIDDEPLDEAFRKIGRWYNADIEIHGKIERNLRLKATFKEEALDEVINFVSISTPIDYEIIEGKYDASGHKQKNKVIIQLKLE
ncbi:FecR family protein [Mangrovibacterium lignilyticum]|uniref:FecR family protein n=1 Tax=Mangrovibacterium lignilyticum TaxID=2668052 RepID=UPI0013D60EFC|nr:FecR domain-containing protein [Mangrovibacterium lignilyticum]